MVDEDTEGTENNNLSGLTESVTFEKRGHPFTPDSASHLRPPPVQLSRSLETIGSGRVYWEDEFHNILSATGVKGLPFEDPKVEFELDPPIFRVHGLMESTYISRIKAVSDFMRSHGLATERVLSVRPLEKVPYKGRQISIKQWKEITIQDPPKEALSFASKEMADPQHGMFEFLERSQFCVIERDYPIAERIRDLGEILNEKQAEEIFSKIFKFINFRDHTNFDAQDKDDQKQYLVDYLPTKMGRYLGKLHFLGLTHGYPTRHNWLVSGDLVDLDSVKGAPLLLNDPKITDEDIKLDITRTMLAISNCLTLLRSSGQIFDPNSETDPLKEALSNFIAAYIQERERQPTRGLQKLTGKRTTIKDNLFPQKNYEQEAVSLARKKIAARSSS